MTEYERELARLGPNAAVRIDRLNTALRRTMTVSDYQKIHPTITTAEAFTALERRMAAEDKLGREAAEEITLHSMYPTMKG